MKIGEFLDTGKAASIQEIMGFCDTEDNTKQVLRHINKIDKNESNPKFAIDKKMLESFRDCHWDDDKRNGDNVRLNDAGKLVSSPAYTRPILYLSLQQFTTLDQDNASAATAALVRHMQTSAEKVILYLFEYGARHKEVVQQILTQVCANVTDNDPKKFKRAIFVARLIHQLTGKIKLQQICEEYPVVANMIQETINTKVDFSDTDTVLMKLCAALGYSEDYMEAALLCYRENHGRIYGQLQNEKPDLQTTIVYFLLGESIAAPDALPRTDVSGTIGEVFIIKNDALAAAIAHGYEDMVAVLRAAGATETVNIPASEKANNSQRSALTSADTTKISSYIGKSAHELRTMLRQALRHGDFTTLGELLVAGVDTTDCDFIGSLKELSHDKFSYSDFCDFLRTHSHFNLIKKDLLLKFVVERGDVEAAKILLAAGAKANNVDLGAVLLNLKNKQEANVLLGALIKAGAHPDQVKALQVAAEQDLGDIVSMLLNLFQDKNAALRDAWEALPREGRPRHEKAAIILLKAGAKDESVSLTAVLECANYFTEKATFSELLKELIAIATTEDKQAAILTAVWMVDKINHYSIEAVQMLLAANINVNKRTKKGETLLTEAVHRGNTQITEMLIDAGADIDAGVSCNSYSYTTDYWTDDMHGKRIKHSSPCYDKSIAPLHIAGYRRDGATLRLLLGKGADINVLAQSSHNDVPACSVLQFVNNLKNYTEDDKKSYWDSTINLLSLWSEIDKIIKKTTDPKACVESILTKFIDTNTPKNALGFLVTSAALPPAAIKAKALRSRILAETATLVSANELLTQLLMTLSEYVVKELSPTEQDEDGKNLAAICNRLIMHVQSKLQVLVQQNANLGTARTIGTGTIKKAGKSARDQQQEVEHALKTHSFKQAGLLLEAGFDTTGIQLCGCIVYHSHMWKNFSLTDFCDFLNKHVKSPLVLRDPLLKQMAEAGYVKAADILLANDARADKINLTEVVRNLNDKQEAHRLVAALIKAGAVSSQVEALQIAAEKNFDGAAIFLHDLLQDKKVALTHALAAGYQKAAAILMEADTKLLESVNLVDVLVIMRNDVLVHRKRCETNIVSVLRVLIAAATSENKQASIVIAIQLGYVETVRMLLTAGVNVKERTKDGKTLLMEAAEHCRLEIATILINAGAEVDAGGVHYLTNKKSYAKFTPNSGITPLHIASCQLDTPTVRLLLEKSADITILSHDLVNDKFYSVLELLNSCKDHSYIDKNLWHSTHNLLSLWSEIDKIIKKTTDPKKCVDDILAKFINVHTPKTSFGFSIAAAALPAAVKKAKELRGSVTEIANTTDEKKTLSDLVMVMSEYVTTELIPTELDDDGKNLAAICNRFILHVQSKLQALEKLAKPLGEGAANDNSSMSNVISDGNMEMREMKKLG